MSGLVIENPIHFANVIVSPNILPGDRIWLRGGTYSGDFATAMAGTAEAPITIQPYNNEPVRIVGSLQIGGAYTHWKNITFINTETNAILSAVYMSFAGTELEDCDISSGGANMGISWFGSGVGKLLNCAIHNTGSYGIYTHNNNGGLREITGCTWSSIGGYYGMHLYSESANNVRDYTVSGCTINKPTVVHGAEISGVQFLTNTFNSWLKIGGAPTDTDTRQAVVDGNTFHGSGSGITAICWSDLTITDNVFAVLLGGIERTNLSVYPGANELNTAIDRNAYTSGQFFVDDTPKTWQQWQALGYDAAGTYS
jgi:hypothetical protein